MTSPLIRVDTTINTNVKYSKVFALAFKKATGTDTFNELVMKNFLISKLNDMLFVGSAIVQLDNVTSGETFHSGRGDENFTGILTKVFSNGISDNVTTNNIADITAAGGVHVYFVTIDGINETAMRITGP